jgi:16S rRNA (guanine527-N7)-methyltransferase
MESDKINTLPDSEQAVAQQLGVLLTKGLAKLDQHRSELEIRLLIKYLLLLNQWNKAFNLTSIKHPETMLKRHLLDSLAIEPHLSGEKFLDVGSGAGLPGVPLAIVDRHRDFDLLDSNGKKIRFLFQVRTQLGLNNIREVQQRVEERVVERGYDGILSRAFASLSDMVQSTQHLLAPGGRFYAMKGKEPYVELKALPKGYNVEAVLKLVVPEVDEDRHLIVIEKK